MRRAFGADLLADIKKARRQGLFLCLAQDLTVALGVPILTVMAASKMLEALRAPWYVGLPATIYVGWKTNRALRKIPGPRGTW